MGKLTLTAGLCLIMASLASSYKLLCYYNSLAPKRMEDGRFTVSNIDPNLCSHMIYAFAVINNQNELVPKSASDVQGYESFTALKSRNPMLKTLLGFGGANLDAQKFSAMLSTQTKRRAFIQTATTLLRAKGFDGINLDWWYPRGASQAQDKLKFTMLCKELKDAFEAEGRTTNRDRLIVSATVSGERPTIDASYEVAKIATHLDFINVLTFDFHGPWENTTGHHSPLFRGSQDTGDDIYLNTDSAMQYWKDQGAPAQKLNLGLAAYGLVFHLASASTSVGAPSSGPGQEGCYTGEDGFWASYEICLYITDDSSHLIPQQKVPYATKDNQWVGFDDKDSLDAKVSYLKANNFGGAVVWSLDLDDFSGQFCKQGNSPFTSHLHSLLVPDFPPTTTTDPNNGNPCKGNGRGVFPNPSDPGSYYNCDHGTAHLQYCPTGLVFKESCSCCTTTSPPTTTTTTAPTTTTTTAPTTTTTTAPTTTTTTPSTTTTTTQPNNGNPCKGNGSGVFPNPSDPGSYYNCDHGTAHLQYCSTGLVFKESCSCCTTTSPPTTTTTTAPTTTTTTAPTTTTTTPSTTTTTTQPNNGNPCKGNGSGVFPNPSDPGSYYNCDHGTAHLQYCSTGLVFKKSCSCCDNP